MSAQISNDGVRPGRIGEILSSVMTDLEQRGKFIQTPYSYNHEQTKRAFGT